MGPDEVEEEFIKVFADTTKVFKQQPGFISAQLHRGIAGSCTFINYVGWESVAHFTQAFDKPEFRENMVKVTSYHCDVSSLIQKSCNRRGLFVWISCCHLSDPNYWQEC